MRSWYDDINSQRVKLSFYFELLQSNDLEIIKIMVISVIVKPERRYYAL